MKKSRKGITKAARIKSMIKKGLYTQRPSGRAPKGKSWNYKTAKYEPSFPAKLVKAANERLRKLEKVHKGIKSGRSLAQSSEAYQAMEEYATSYPKTKGKIYKRNKEGNIRFLSQTEFDRLSAQDKKYYVDRVQAFLGSKSSTASGIKEAHKKSYDTFMKRYGDKYPELSFSQYEEFFDAYNYNMVEDSESHFGYDEWSAALKHIKIDEAMNDNQMDQIMEYLRANDWVGLSKNEDLKQYLQRI